MTDQGLFFNADAAGGPAPVKPRRRRRKRKTYTWELHVYTAPWCVPWPLLDKELTSWEAQNPDVKVVRVNVDDDPHAADRNQIVVLPTVLVMRDGVERQRLLGAMNTNDFSQAVK